MSYYLVSESRDLSGCIRIQGAKNLILPLMAAALLVDGETIFDNCPDILDVRYTMKMLEGIGCRVSLENSTLSIDTSGFDLCNISSEYSKKMRSSFLFLGPLLSRCKKARVSMPGGCNIGKRPVDIHLKAFRQMGVIINEEGDIYADAAKLKDAYIRFDFPSVGATENAILLAVKSDIKVVLENAAREPEIREMCSILNRMGARIIWDSNDRIVIYGVNELNPIRALVMGDRICVGTYISAVGICGGDIKIKGINKSSLMGIAEVFTNMGISITGTDYDTIRVRCHKRPDNLKSITTEPFPGFPTDMQSQLMVLASVSNGELKINENIFENRFRIVPELIKMHADVKLDNNTAIVNGVDRLVGTEVNATDLRGGAALVLAGLAAKGVTRLNGIDYIKRGYEDIIRDISMIGGNISIIEG